jgi:hypothetical protein
MVTPWKRKWYAFILPQTGVRDKRHYRDKKSWTVEGFSGIIGN